ncbi:MAG: hypothetical protein AB7I30_24300 [Isosphaeraceae bacterium]
MKHNSPRLFGMILGFAGLVSIARGQAPDADFQVGFATAEITPPVGWRRAGGYTEKISDGVKDPLMAKAVVVTQGTTSFAFVGNDLCSVPRELTGPARKRASEVTGIPIDQIVITATHTHGGPEYQGPLREVLHARAARDHQGNDPHEPIDYRARLIDAWVDVIARAQAARKSARLSVVAPYQEGLAFNRRYLMKDGSTGWIPGKKNPQIFRPLGPTDPELPFVMARDADTGEPLGALTVFAMHTAIHGGPRFSACYPGHLQTRLREKLDAPRFVSIFGEGCAGDVNHVDVNDETPQPGETYPAIVGARLAETIAEALPHAREIRGGSMAVRSKTVLSPVGAVTDAEYHAAMSLLERLDQNQAPFLTVVDAWRKAYRREFWTRYGGMLPEEVQVCRLDGDTAIVTLPHEVFVELGIAIKAGSPFRTTIVVTLANDTDFYIPTRRAFEEGHYEPTTCPLLPGCGEALVRTALEVLNELKSP